MKAVKFNCLANNRTREYLTNYDVFNQPSYKQQQKAVKAALKAANDTLGLIDIMKVHSPSYNDYTKQHHPFLHLMVIDVTERMDVEWKAVQHTIHQLEAIARQIQDHGKC